MRGFEDQEDVNYGVNFILTWGCPPSSGVPAKSSIVTSYTEHLVKKIKKGVLVLPEGLQSYSGSDGKAETLPKCKAYLWLDCTLNNRTNIVKTNSKERFQVALKGKLAGMIAKARIELAAEAK